jgi:hypothetical protein
MGRLWDWLIEHVMQHGRALRDAPLVFVAVLVIAFILSSWVNSARYEGVLDQKNATIEGLKSQIDNLRSVSLPQQKPAPAARDPDGIFQMGVQVGSVLQPHSDESKGVATFGAIIGATKFNAERDFEYRDLVLHIRSLGTETRGSIAGQQSRALNQVTCEIVGHVSR